MYGFDSLSQFPISAVPINTPANESLWYTYDTLASIPTGNNALSKAFKAADYTAVATLDSSYFDDSGVLAHRLLMFQINHANNTDPITPTWTGKAPIAAATANVLLQIYNYVTPGWETIATDSTTAANTTLTLTGSKLTSLSSYYSGNNLVTMRVYQ